MNKLTDLIELGGVAYKINLDVMSDLLVSDDTLQAQEMVETDKKDVFDKDGNLESSEVFTKTYQKTKEFDAARFDILGSMFNIVLNYHDEMDDALGIDRALDDTTLPFKIAYNTLLTYGILEAIEVEE